MDNTTELKTATTFSYIWTVVMYSVASGDISTVSYRNFDDAVKYCMEEIRQELDNDTFEKYRQEIFQDLDEGGYYMTSDTRYEIFEAGLFEKYTGL